MLRQDDVYARRESRVRSYCRAFDVEVATARGSVLQDTAGRELVDFLAGAGSLNYGHNHPRLKTALLDYVARDGLAMGLDLHTEAKRDFLEAFESHVLAPRHLDHVVQFTGPTGTNAVEAGLKLARAITGRHGIVAFTNGFHGMTMGALAATGSGFHREPVRAGLGGVTRVPYDGYADGVDGAALLDAMLDDPSSGIDPPAVVLLETVQGEGGLNVASPQWLRRVADVAHRHGALLMVDDIQAGCGRTGTFFSFEGTGVVPDLVALSKSLSGYGLPLAVLLLRPELDRWEPGQHNGTFRGNQHAFVTGAAALREFWADPAFERGLAAGEALLADRLAELAALVPGSRTKGRGWMRGIALPDPDQASAVRARCFERGLIVELAGPRDEVVKLLPPLTTPVELLDKGLGILEQAVLDTVPATPRPGA